MEAARLLCADRTDKAKGSAVVLFGLQLASVIACLGCRAEPDRGSDVAEVQGAFSNHFGGEDCPLGLPVGTNCLPDHEEITVLGLNFLRPEIQNFLARQNALFDVCNVSGSLSSVTSTFCPLLLPSRLLYGSTTAYAHFDNCTFDGSISSVVRNYRLAVSASRYDVAAFSCPDWGVSTCVGPATGADALSYFAAVTHTMQDFYSHTNWVELGHAFTDLFDTSLDLPATPSPAGLFVADGGHPLFSVDPKTRPRPDVTVYPNDVLPVENTMGLWTPALISGVTTQGSSLTATWPQDCPEVVDNGPFTVTNRYYVTHGALAKDDPTLHPQQYVTARSAAILRRDMSGAD